MRHRELGVAILMAATPPEDLLFAVGNGF